MTTQPSSKFTVVAFISAHNEGDIIAEVIGDLVRQGVSVYLFDNCSTDDTVARAKPWLGRGLLHIERFPDDAGYPEENRTAFCLSDILKRIEELSVELGANWYISHDADEIREPLLPGLSLATAFKLVDLLGYNAIDFKLINFRPVNDDFRPGMSLKKTFQFFEWGEPYNDTQIKAWKNTGVRVDLATSGSHNVSFPNRRIFPVKFLLRHYPIRSQAHGEKKVFRERKTRFYDKERQKGWHVQYDEVDTRHSFIYPRENLRRYVPVVTKLLILARVLYVNARSRVRALRQKQ